MLQHLFYEMTGVVMVSVAFALMWIARPVDGKPALFLRRKGRYEIGYALIILFVLCGGLGCMLLGFTT